MSPTQNWNHERWRTRDRLLDYDFNIVPPHPHSGGFATPYPVEETDLSPMLPMFGENSTLLRIYPWEEYNSTALEREILIIAQRNGYTGTSTEFWAKFQYGNVITGTIEIFPVPGDTRNLYLDLTTEILYYFKEITLTAAEAEQLGAVIVGENYAYIPVRALLIEDTILNSGDAAEYID